MCRREANQGMNWIRPEKRLALYLRDGLACSWCGRGVEEEDITLTLDHLRPVSRGGGNGASNLVTSCRRCNSARGDRPMRRFAEAVSLFEETDSAPEILRRIRRNRTRRVPLREAKKIIASRSTFTEALARASEETQ